MSTELLAYAQIASILGYVGSVFVIYKLLVSQKDATIEMLNTRIESLKAEKEELRKQSPDVLSESLSERAKLLTDELRIARDELATSRENRARLQEEIKRMTDELEARSAGVTVGLIHQLAHATSELAQETARTDDLLERISQLDDIQEGLFFSEAIHNLPLHLLMEAVQGLGGVGWVLGASKEQIRDGFDVHTMEVKNGGLENFLFDDPIDLKRLRDSNFVGVDGQITDAGIEALKSVARMKMQVRDSLDH